jgi:hypothetical protein
VTSLSERLRDVQGTAESSWRRAVDALQKSQLQMHEDLLALQQVVGRKVDRHEASLLTSAMERIESFAASEEALRAGQAKLAKVCRVPVLGADIYAPGGVCAPARRMRAGVRPCERALLSRSSRRRIWGRGGCAQVDDELRAELARQREAASEVASRTSERIGRLADVVERLPVRDEIAVVQKSLKEVIDAGLKGLQKRFDQVGTSRCWSPLVVVGRGGDNCMGAQEC